MVREVEGPVGCDRVAAPSVLMDKGPSREGAVEEILGLLAGPPSHEHLAGRFVRAKLAPIENAVDDGEVRQTDGALDERCCGEWRSP